MAYDQLLGMTASELGTEVSRNLGLGSTVPSSQDKIYTWLTQTQRVVAQRWEWSALDRTDSSLVVEDGVLSYSYGPQVRRILDARLIDDTCYVLDGCDSGWSKNGSWMTNGAVTHDTNMRRMGTASTKITLNYQDVQADGDIIAYSGDRSTALDVSGITAGAIGLWIFTDFPLSATDLDLVLTEDSAGAETTTYVTTSLPAIPAGQWTYVRLTSINLSTIDALLSIGIRAGGDLSPDSGERNIWIDSINLYKLSYGGQNWPITIMNQVRWDEIAVNPYYTTENRPVLMAMGGRHNNSLPNSFDLYPIPDNEYPVWIRYLAWPEDIRYDSADFGTVTSTVDNVTQLGAEFDLILIAGATWIGFMSERQWHSANQWEGTFRRLLSEAIRSDSSKKGVEPIMEGAQTFRPIAVYDRVEVPSSTQGGLRGTTTGYFYLC